MDTTKTKKINPAAKTIVVLDLTSPPINLCVLFVKKENGKIKLANRAAKFVLPVNTTMQLDKLLKLVVKVAVLVNTMIYLDKYKKFLVKHM